MINKLETKISHGVLLLYTLYISQQTDMIWAVHTPRQEMDWVEIRYQNTQIAT
jgi:hypothetical protein